jgi:hypothetical protein
MAESQLGASPALVPSLPLKDRSQLSPGVSEDTRLTYFSGMYFFNCASFSDMSVGVDDFELIRHDLYFLLSQVLCSAVRRGSCVSKAFCSYA